jgi:hypothetical protein
MQLRLLAQNAHQPAPEEKKISVKKNNHSLNRISMTEPRKRTIRETFTFEAIHLGAN